MHRSLVAASFIAALSYSGMAKANGYDAWSAYSVPFKEGFVIGAVEVLGNLSSPSNPYFLANTIGIHNCIIDLMPSPRSLASIVDNFYQMHVHLNELGPAMILHRALGEICLDQINAARNQFGLGELPVPEVPRKTK